MSPTTARTTSSSAEDGDGVARLRRGLCAGDQQYSVAEGGDGDSARWELEAARAEVADYDPRARTLHVRGKAGHERLLPVPASVAAALDDYLAGVGWQPGPLLRPDRRSNYDP